MTPGAFWEISARARVPGNSNTRARDAEVLGANLLQAYSHSSNLAGLHTHAPDLVAVAGERPLATRAARYQAQDNGL